MPDTKHSMSQAAAIQKAFESKYASMDGIVGVGIGLNQKQDDLALNVFVSSHREAAKLPVDFEGLDVVVDVVQEGFRPF